MDYMFQSKDIEWVNGNKKKTHKYVACNRLTSDLKDTQTERGWQKIFIIYNNHDKDATTAPINRWMHEEDVIPPHSAIKKNDALPFVTVWTDLEAVMLKWVKSSRKGQTLYDFTFTWNLNNKTNEIQIEQNKTDTEIKQVVSTGERGRRRKEIDEGD